MSLEGCDFSGLAQSQREWIVSRDPLLEARPVPGRIVTRSLGAYIPASAAARPTTAGQSRGATSRLLVGIKIRVFLVIDAFLAILGTRLAWLPADRSSRCKTTLLIRNACSLGAAEIRACPLL